MGVAVFGMNLLNGISDSSGSPPSFVGFMLVVLVVLLIFLGLGAGGTLYLYRNKTLVL
jgi:low affinity Fe/Cu permease